MTYYDVYIGALDDPGFSWGGKGQEGSPPGRISPLFPPTRGKSGGYPGGAFGDLVAAIERGRFDGKRVDWGAWVAVVPKAEIEEFIDELYAEDETYGPGSAFPHLVDRLQELKTFLADLKSQERYALVASEL